MLRLGTFDDIPMMGTVMLIGAEKQAKLLERNNESHCTIPFFHTRFLTMQVGFSKEFTCLLCVL
jgi:hypothetical protein